jgi:DNA-binding protein YbaB
MPDLEGVLRELNLVTENAERRQREFATMRDGIAAITVTGEAAGGAVRASVDADGVLVDLAMTSQATALRPNELATAVLRATQAAQGQISDQVQSVVDRTTPGEPSALTGHVLGRLRARFPRQDEAALGPATDDEYFGELNIMRPATEA